MNRNLKLTLIACALGAASVTSAQTSNNIPPPNDVVRLPGNVTTPTMPVVVSPPRDNTGRGTAAGSANSAAGQLPLVRSLGDSMDETLSDGPATGASAPVDTAAPNAGDAPAPDSNAATSSDSGSEASDNAGTGAAAGKDTSGASTEPGARSRIVDTGNAATEQNAQQDRQRGDSSAAPDRFGTPPAKGTPNAPTSIGK